MPHITLCSRRIRENDVEWTHKVEIIIPGSRWSMHGFNLTHSSNMDNFDSSGFSAEEILPEATACTRLQVGSEHVVREQGKRVYCGQDRNRASVCELEEGDCMQDRKREKVKCVRLVENMKLRLRMKMEEFARENGREGKCVHKGL